MAGGQERILRGRIRSVQATKKITRAMELIAASRIVKAQQRVQAAVPYSDLITTVVKDLAAAGAGKASPLLAGRDEVAGDPVQTYLNDFILPSAQAAHGRPIISIAVLFE